MLMLWKVTEGSKPVVLHKPRALLYSSSMLVIRSQSREEMGYSSEEWISGVTGAQAAGSAAHVSHAHVLNARPQ
jgi:hypothetical protein